MRNKVIQCQLPVIKKATKTLTNRVLHESMTKYCMQKLLDPVTDHNYYKSMTFLVELCSGLEVNCYYFEEDDVCESPRVGCPEHWVEESEQAEVNPWRAVYGDSL